MSTGVGTGVAGDVFQVDTGSGSGIRPDPKRYTNNYSVFFNGIDQYLQGTARAAGGPEVPLLGDSGLGDFSVSLWFKGDNINPNYGQNLINNSDFSEIGSNIVNQFDVDPYSNGWSLSVFPNNNVSPLTQVLWQPNQKAVVMTVGVPAGNAETQLFASFTPDQDAIYKFQVEVKTTDANIFRIHTNVASNLPTTGGNRYQGSAFAQGTGSYETLTLYGRGGDKGQAMVFRLQASVSNQSTRPPGTFTAQFRNPTLQKIDPNNYWIESNISPTGTTGWYPTDGELRMDEGNTLPYLTNFPATLSSNKLNNANFSEIGSELVQNHAFNEISGELIDLTSGSANSCPSFWEVLTENSITWVTGCSSSVGFYSTGFTVQAGKAYRISLTIEGYSGTGNIGVSTAGGVPISVRLTGDGTVTTTFVATGNNVINIFGRNTNVGTFSNISLKQLDPDDDWTVESGWELRFGDARRSGVSVNSGIGQTFNVSSGKTYKIGYDRTYESGTNGTTNMFGAFTNSGVSEVKCQEVSTAQETVTVTDHFIPQYTGSTGSMRWFGIGDWTGTFDNCTFREMDPNNYWSNPSAHFDVFIKEGFAEFINAATGNRLQQNFGVVTGQEYQVSFEIFDYSSGAVNAYLGGGYVSQSSGTPVNLTANGTYTFYRTAASGNNEFFFRAMNANSNFKIRNITVKEFDPGTMYRTLRNNAIAQLQNSTEYKVVIDFGNFTTVGTDLAFFSFGEPFSNRTLIPAGTTGVYEFNHTPTGTGNPGLYCSDNPVQIKSISVTENQAVNHRLWSFGSGGGAVQTQMQVNKGSNIQVSGPYSQVASNFTIERNRWYNVILRVARSGTALTSGIVINGSHKENTNKTVPTQFNQAGLAFIGRNAGSYNFEGHIDEFSIWNKNLSDAECLEIYNNGVPNNLNASTMSTNLMHWWRMGELPGPPSFPTIIDQAQTTTSGNQVENGNFTEVGSELITNPEFQILNNIVRNPNFDELGTEIVPDGNFTNQAAVDFWDIATSPPGATPRATKSLQNGFMRLTYDLTNGSALFKSGILTSGKTYKVTFRAKGTATNKFGSIGDNNNISSNPQYVVSNPNLTTSFQNYEFCVPVTSSLLRLYLLGSVTVGQTLDITNISVKQVDPDGDWSSNPTDSWKYTSNNTVTYTNEVVGSELVQNGQFNELGSEVVLNGDFEELGTELAVNGTFDTSIPIGTVGSGWQGVDTLPDGNNVAQYFDGGVKLTRGTGICRLRLKTAAGSSTTIQTTTGYKLTYEVKSNPDNADLRVYFAGPSSVPVPRTVGTHTFYITSGSQAGIMQFQNNTNNSSIVFDNVSIKEVDPNDRWTLGSGWSYGNEAIEPAFCDGTNVGVSNLETTAGLSGIQNERVKFSFEIKNYSAGTITVTVEGTGGNEFSNLNANGTYTTYVTSTDSAPKILFKANPGFIGAIDNVSVKQVDPNNNWTFNSAYWNITDTANALGVANGSFNQTLAVQSGKKYKIEVASTITSGNGIYAVKLGTNQQIFDNNTSNISTVLVASGDNVAVSIQPGASAFSVSSVSVKEVTGDSSLVQTSVLDIGKTYKFTVAVDSIGSGKLQLKAGSSFLLEDMEVPNTFTGLFRVQSTTLTLRAVNVNLGDSIVVSKITAEELPFFATISTNQFGGGLVDSPTLTIDGAKGLKLGGTASELFASNLFQNDRTYQVQADVKSVVSGNFRIVSRNAANSTGPISTPGLHTFSFNTGTLVSATYFISNNGNFNGVINSVSLKELDPNNNWTPDDGWTLGSGFARYYNPGVAGNLTQTGVAVIGDLYQITVKTLSDATGNLGVALGGSTQFFSNVTPNTTYNMYIVAQATSFRVRAATNFSGSITGVQVKRISGGASMTAIDMTMNNQTASDIQTDTP